MKRTLLAIALLGWLVLLAFAPALAQQSVYVQTLFDNAAVAVGATTGTIHGTLTDSATSYANTGTGEETAWTYSLPANTLNANGRALRVTAWGSVAANANTKAVKLYFGSTAQSTISTSGSGIGWKVTYTVIRTGSAAEVVLGRDAYWGSNNTSIGVPGSPTEDTTAAITIKLTVQGAAASDVTFRGAMVEAVK